MKIELTERDRELFKVINDYGMLSTNQILMIVFPQIDNSTALARLRKLKYKKYIQSHSGLPKGQLVWTLALKSRQIIDSDLEINVNKNQLEHDVLISEVRFRLEQNGVCRSWTSGFKLKQLISKKDPQGVTQTSQIPDGIFSVQMPSGPQVVALELELVSKTKRRYRDILQNYSSNSKIKWVWYLVNSNSLGNLLCEEANAIPRADGKKWLFSSNLADALNSNASIVLTNQNHSIVLLKAPQADTQSLGTQTQK
ncbi:MAG: replication-relaxation family protein [Pseudobdellovibrionaceae bacterium]